MPKSPSAPAATCAVSPMPSRFLSPRPSPTACATRPAEARPRAALSSPGVLASTCGVSAARSTAAHSSEPASERERTSKTMEITR